jgi:hypothetical protein
LGRLASHARFGIASGEFAPDRHLWRLGETFDDEVANLVGTFDVPRRSFSLSAGGWFAVPVWVFSPEPSRWVNRALFSQVAELAVAWVDGSTGLVCAGILGGHLPVSALPATLVARRRLRPLSYRRRDASFLSET